MNANFRPRGLPYGRQSIDDDDVAAVTDALRGDFLTTGPWVSRFEQALCEKTSARHAIAVSNCTAALHLAARALSLETGTWTIVPTNTFLATANAVRLNGGEVQFADVDPNTGRMTADTFSEALARCPGRVRAAIPVHYAGPSSEMPAIAALARNSGVTLLEDAAHAIGTIAADGTRVGSCAHSLLTCFSFHPVKTMTTGEGGAILTNDEETAAALRRDRSHGMTREADEFSLQTLAFDGNGTPNPWHYEMSAPGLNYRITDIQCALGLSQLKKLDAFKSARARIKATYDQAFANFSPVIRTPIEEPGASTAWHLYPVQVDFEFLNRQRADVMRRLQAHGVGTQVHYIPVHLQPYYRDRYGLLSLAGAERHFRETLSLPLFPGMNEDDVHYVVDALLSALGLSTERKTIED